MHTSILFERRKMNLFDELDTLDLHFKNASFSMREFKKTHADVIAQFLNSLQPIEPETPKINSPLLKWGYHILQKSKKNIRNYFSFCNNTTLNIFMGKRTPDKVTCVLIGSFMLVTVALFK